MTWSQIIVQGAIFATLKDITELHREANNLIASESEKTRELIEKIHSSTMLVLGRMERKIS
ncbi:TPA: hypothetical protein DCX16_04770 [bacterium]|nr:hypothetical protein [bacterium]